MSWLRHTITAFLRLCIHSGGWCHGGEHIHLSRGHGVTCGAASRPRGRHRQVVRVAGAFVVSALHRRKASGAGDGAFVVSALHRRKASGAGDGAFGVSALH